MKDDQWFEPGDKVMRVCYGGMIPEMNGVHFVYEEPDAVFGKVYCVTDFMEHRTGNMMTLAGLGGWGEDPNTGEPYSFACACFRRVEEIKLCVNAVAKKPEKEPLNIETK